MLAMRRFYFSFLIFSALLSGPCVRGDDVEQHIRDQYLGRTFILRGFYKASSLHFDSAGVVRESTSGDWTVDGVLQIDDIKLSPDRLKVRANRLHFGWLQDSGFGPVQDPPPPPGVDVSKERIVQIEYELDSVAPRSDAAARAWSRIFLAGNDSFLDLVPEYWKPCVDAAIGASPNKNYAGCQFSRDFLAIPGVATQGTALANSAPKWAQDDTPPNAQNHPSFRVGTGVSPPKLLSNLQPGFSQEARTAKFHGKILLGLNVEKDGSATNVHVIRPLGCGLDAKAVEVVQEWKFKPAEKDGEPVRVAIAVEVEFHLY